MDAFDRLVEGEPACLVEAALCMAADVHRGLDVSAYVAKCARMAADFARFRSDAAAGPGLLEELNRFFFGALGFSGAVSDYYDPANSYLDRVIDRRKGIPISLSVLYRALARSAGIDLAGINLPGHFMLAYPTGAGTREYIDVFHGGCRLDWPQCVARLRGVLGGGGLSPGEEDFTPMTDRAILVRMLRNLKGIHSRDGICRCIPVQERLVRLLRDDPRELRDLAIMYYLAQRPIDSIGVFDRLEKRYPSFREDSVTREYRDRAVHEATLIN